MAAFIDQHSGFSFRQTKDHRGLTEQRMLTALLQKLTAVR